MGVITSKRITLGTVGLLFAGLVVWLIAGSSRGTPNPVDPNANLSHAAVIIDSGILVLREGLETSSCSRS